MAKSLALEMRPKTFADYMGDSIRNTLTKRMSNKDDYPHTILLWGTRGCGKTTAARLLAKEYLCLDKTPDGRACGQCQNCLDIEETLIDNEAGMETTGVIELDIATDSNKAVIDSVLEDALEAPMWPLEYKILILDECHMASKQAQNRLLKITEEPPAHLVLIFCTTDPDMMLPTLLDRCQLKIQVKKADLKEMSDRMMKCCVEKGWHAGRKAIEAIVKQCDRNPRKCWNALEAISSEYNKEISIENVSAYFGGVDDNLYFNYIQAARNGIKDILEYVNELNDKGVEYKDFINDFSGFILGCVEVRYGINLDAYPSDFVKLAKKFFDSYNAQEVDTLLQIVEHANTMVSRSLNNNEMLKLIVSNTALRIGKIELLSKGLQNEYMIVGSENQKGHSKAIDRIQSVGKNVSVQSEIVGDALLASTFGQNITEVKPGDKEDLIPSIKDDTGSGQEWTEEMLFSLLKE